MASRSPLLGVILEHYLSTQLNEEFDL